MNGSTRVLQNWQPTVLDEYHIRTGLISEVERILGPFRAAYWTVRGPSYESPRSNLIWHYDDPSRDFYSIVWSNILPTEFAGGFEAQPGDIILIRNLEMTHRTPPKLENSLRWFAQFYDITSSTTTKLGKRFR